MSRFTTETTREQLPWEVLSSRITCVLGANPSEMTLNGTNCYLVGTGQRRLLVDAAERHFGNADFLESLAQAMTAVGCTALDGIVITHLHSDHYGGVEALQRVYGPVPVYVSEIGVMNNMMQKPWDEFSSRDLLNVFVDPKADELFYHPVRDPPPNASDAPFCTMEGMDFSFIFEGKGKGKGSSVGKPTAKGKGRGPPSANPPSDYHVFVGTMVSWMWESSRFREKLRQGDIEWRRLEHEGRIETEGATLRCLYAPGHAEDHFVFLLEEENALLSGDHVLGHGTTFVTDMHDYMGTLVSMLDLQPAMLCPGHGPHIADAVGLLSRYLDHRRARLEQICQCLATLQGPFSATELTRKLYLDTQEQNMELAVDNVERILRQLVREGRLAMLTGDPSDGKLLTPMSAPSSYKVWKLPPGIFFREVEVVDAKVTAAHTDSVSAAPSRL